MTSSYEDISVGLLKDSSLVGNFAMPPPNFYSNFSEVNIITSSTKQSLDPWIVPLESKLSSYGNEMILSHFELAYQEMQMFSDPTSSNIDQVDMVNEYYSPFPWLEPVSLFDRFNCVFPTYHGDYDVGCNSMERSPLSFIFSA